MSLTPLRVLAVTSWQTSCGIAAYAEMVQQFVQEADPDISLEAFPEALDPEWLRRRLRETPELLHPHVLWLNYHRGLHSRWTPDLVQAFRQNFGLAVVVTFHDTYGEREPDALTQELHDLADAFIVHEPCMGLPKQMMVRQGVLPRGGTWQYDTSHHGWCLGRPILGTVGFNFPWKNYDRLAEVTEEAGWALLILANNATPEDLHRWEGLNPACQAISGFLPADMVVAKLAGCDATAFAYECANSGTSGAIRLGLAARKPVLAFESCRQFRDLLFDNAYGVTWLKGWHGFEDRLRQVPIQRLDPGIAFLAHRDRWPLQGRVYAHTFRLAAAR